MDKILTFNGKIATGGVRWITRTSSTPDPYNPLGLLEYTIRLEFNPGVIPRVGSGWLDRVSSNPNIWDLRYEYTDWNSLLVCQTDLIKVLGANTSLISNMVNMFQGCTSLTSVALFDTRHVGSMRGMFQGCSSLTAVPLFDTGSVQNMEFMCGNCTSLITVPLLDTSSARDMGYMFQSCVRVESGALALYQQASSQSNPVQDYNSCFEFCGIETLTGAAELAQIPTSWGGTMN